ncbi:MAG: T9SS type A sorting domain-containing protein [Bacteroidales bacterium]|nr:T9SS type A sorting domain-containing protein [Bacteroidales bacterium]
MKKTRLFLTTLFVCSTMLTTFAQPTAVDSFLVDPFYPVIDAPLTIYVNADYFGLTTDDGNLSAWTGLITSASTDLTDNWVHNPISDWGDMSVLITPVEDVENDSVYMLEIDDIATFYSVTPAEETVFRVAFIARGHSGGSVSGQTRNIYFEIFGVDPDSVGVAYPSEPYDNERISLDFNINQATNQTLADYIADNPGDTVFAHIGITTDAGGWQHVLTDWGVNVPENTLLTVSDSVYRLYIEPNAREYFNLEESELTEGINVVLRNSDGSAQTEDLYYEIINTGGGIGISENTAELINMYPNPAYDYVYVDLGSAQSATLNIFDASGRHIYTNALESGVTSIPVSDITNQSQMLYYQIVTEQGVSQGQIVITR